MLTLKADPGMSTIFLITGIVVTVAGAVALAFGVPINAFEFGNTLIVSGTIAFVGGLLLTGIAMTIRELHVIARNLVQDRPRTAVQSSDDREQDKGEIPFPISKVLKRTSRREPDVVGGEGFSSNHHEDLSDLSIAPAETPAYSDESSLSARSTKNDLFMRSQDAAAERPFRAERHFDAIWGTDRDRSGASNRGSSGSDPRDSNYAASEPAERRSSSPDDVTILKSGVIDGMAYTLYSDGSIEAELPQGMLRFESIDDLRAHLAKHE